MLQTNTEPNRRLLWRNSPSITLSDATCMSAAVAPSFDVPLVPMAVRFVAGSNYWTALISGAALAACSLTYTASTCESHNSTSSGCKDFMTWLQRQGAKIDGLQFRHAQVGLNVQTAYVRYPVYICCHLHNVLERNRPLYNMLHTPLQDGLHAECRNGSFCCEKSEHRRHPWHFMAELVSIRTSVT